MKKLLALVLSLSLAFAGIVAMPQKAEAGKTQNLVFGTTYTNTLKSSYYSTDSDYYNFYVSPGTEVYITVETLSTSADISWKLSGDKAVFPSVDAPTRNIMAYLPVGNYKLRVYGTGKYSFKIVKKAFGKFYLNKRSGTVNSKKTVNFSYTGTSDYAKAGASIKTSNKKVATASVEISDSIDGRGMIHITPHHIGTCVITVKLARSNSIKYRVYCTSGYWFVAKGSKAKAPKPYGVKKPKWKSSRKKVIKIKKKSGRIKAKKGGRCTLIAKKGKKKYRVKVVVTDFIKLARKTYREIKDSVNNPDRLKVYNVYKGYSRQVYTGMKTPVILIDFGSTNAFGAMIRQKIGAWYDTVHQPHYTWAMSPKNIIKKKRIKTKKITRKKKR